MGDIRSDSRRMDTHPPVCLGSLGGHTVHFTYRPSLCFQWSYLELSRSSMTDRNDVLGELDTLSSLSGTRIFLQSAMLAAHENSWRVLVSQLFRFQQ